MISEKNKKIIKKNKITFEEFIILKKKFFKKLAISIINNNIQ